jgi:hypothetical protein
MPGSLIRMTGRVSRNGRLRTIAEIVGAVLLLSGGAAAGSVATSSTISGATSTAIHGCVNTKTGALSVLLKAGAKCPRGTKPLSWSVTGPRGPAGTTAFGSKTNRATANTSAGAQCTLGEALLMPGKTIDASTIPADGQVLPISTNVALFSLYGTQYGGNGTTNFAVPNLRKAAPNGLTYVICVAGVFP